jgi:hypothetical protein
MSARPLPVSAARISQILKSSAAIIGVLLAGCGYRPDFMDCAIDCSSASGCPGGFSCGAESLCRAAGATATCGAILDAAGDSGDALAVDATGCPNDMDCDGVPDDVDNCPKVRNADQLNEDGDRFGDACDPCPPYPDSDPIVDTDHDGVSDACDPNPSTPGDYIFFFDGFEKNLPGTWSQSAGSSWTGDGLGDASIMSTSAVATLFTPAPPSGHETLTASLTLAADTIGAEVATIDDYQDADGSGVRCALIYSNTPEVQLDGGGLGQEHAYPWNGGSTYILSERRDGNVYGCHVVDAADPSNAADTASGTTTLDNASPQLGLHVGETTSATFQWVMIVSNP